jgi:hypothetical protein
MAFVDRLNNLDLYSKLSWNKLQISTTFMEHAKLLPKARNVSI